MKSINKLLLMVVAFAFVLVGIVSVAKAEGVEDGSQENPWIIDSWDGLVIRVAEVQGFFRLESDINGGEESSLVIPANAMMNIDLNGHTFSCDSIVVGEYEESGAKDASLGIVSSGGEGTFQVASIEAYGNLGFTNCSATITECIFGDGQKFALDDAMVTCQGTNADMSFAWYGTNVSLNDESTLDIGEMPLYVSGDTGIYLEYGCVIKNICFINVDSSTPEEYRSVVEKYASATGYLLSYDSDTGCYYFTNENGDEFLNGELASDEIAETEVYKVTFLDEDGTELQSSEVKKGQMPSYTGDKPTKAADDLYEYTFAGWTPAVVTVTADATYKAKYTFRRILSAEMIGAISPVMYDGDPKTPKVIVKDGEKVLNLGVDYTVSYADNSDVTRDEAGTVISGAKATVTGIGDYSGTQILSFMVKPKNVTITAKSEELTYDGVTHACSDYTVDGLVGNDAIEATVIGSVKFPSESPVTNKVTGYKFTKGKADNYEVAMENGRLTVLKGKVIVQVDDKSKVCGTEDPELTATVNGLVGGDKLIYNLSREKGENVGEYEIKVMLGDNPNYEVSVTGAKFTITKDNTNNTDPSHSTVQDMSGDASDYPEYFYVAKDGTTCAEITRNDIIFLMESSGAVSTWYGLDNSKGAFEKGSEFGVRLLNPEDDSTDWREYYGKLDDEHRECADKGNLWIFLAEVTNASGEKYTKLDQPGDLYVQLGDDWNDDDIRIVYISDITDEQLQVVIIPDYVLPDGTVTHMAKVTLNHFSPYALIQVSKDSEMNEAAPATGKTGNPRIWLVFAVLSCGVLCLTGASGKASSLPL